MSVSHNIPVLFAIIAFVASAVFIFILALNESRSDDRPNSTSSQSFSEDL